MSHRVVRPARFKTLPSPSPSRSTDRIPSARRQAVRVYAVWSGALAIVSAPVWGYAGSTPVHTDWGSHQPPRITPGIHALHDRVINSGAGPTRLSRTARHHGCCANPASARGVRPQATISRARSPPADDGRCPCDHDAVSCGERRARHDAEQELGEREYGDRPLPLRPRHVSQRHQPRLGERVVKRQQPAAIIRAQRVATLHLDRDQTGGRLHGDIHLQDPVVRQVDRRASGCPSHHAARC